MVKIFWNRIGKVGLFTSPDKTQAALAVLVLLQQVSPPNTQSSLWVCKIKLKQDPIVTGSVESVSAFLTKTQISQWLPTFSGFHWVFPADHLSLGDIQNVCIGYKVWPWRNKTWTHVHMQIAQRPRWLQHEKHRVKGICTNLTFFFNAQIFNFNVNYTTELFPRGPWFILLAGHALNKHSHNTLFPRHCSEHGASGLTAHYSISAKKVKLLVS